MKHLKKFEAYSEQTDKELGMMSKLIDNGFVKSTAKILSILDDIIHLDFDLLPGHVTKKGKITRNKFKNLMITLGYMKHVLKRDGEISIEDMQHYGIDSVNLDFLEDEDVKEYLIKDEKFNKRLFDKGGSYYDLVKLLQDFRNWENN